MFGNFPNFSGTKNRSRSRSQNQDQDFLKTGLDELTQQLLFCLFLTITNESENSKWTGINWPAEYRQ